VTPWLLITALLAAINLLGLLVVLGRWGRVVGALAIAALIGTAVGNAVGGLTGLEVLRLGDYHVVAASIGAQLLMLGTLLLSALVPAREADQ
jgi:hypothetical protein